MVVGLYAGFIAERLYDPQALESHAADDEAQAWCLPRDDSVRVPGCSYIGDEAYDHYLEQRRKEARRLVVSLKDVIETLAEALLQHGTMTGESLERLVNQGLGRA